MTTKAKMRNIRFRFNWFIQLVYPNDGEKDEKTVTRLACDLQHVISNCHLSFRWGRLICDDDAAVQRDPRPYFVLMISDDFLFGERLLVTGSLTHRLCVPPLCASAGPATWGGQFWPNTIFSALSHCSETRRKGNHRKSSKQNKGSDLHAYEAVICGVWSGTWT